MDTYNAFIKFQNFGVMDFESLQLAKDYIAGNLNSPGINY